MSTKLSLGRSGRRCGGGNRPTCQIGAGRPNSGFAEPIEHPTYGIVYEQIRFPVVTDVADPKALEQQRKAVRDAAREQLQPRDSKPATVKPGDSSGERKAGETKPAEEG